MDSQGTPLELRCNYIDTPLEYRFQYKNWFHSWNVTLPLCDGKLTVDNVADGWLLKSERRRQNPVPGIPFSQAIRDFTEQIGSDLRQELAYLREHPEHPEYNNYIQTLTLKNARFLLDDLQTEAFFTAHKMIPELQTMHQTNIEKNVLTYQGKDPINYKYELLADSVILRVYKLSYPDEQKIGYRLFSFGQ